MERGFQILAVALAMVAAYFYFISDSDASLISGVLASCSFFISYRFRIKARLNARIAETNPSTDEGTKHLSRE